MKVDDHTLNRISGQLSRAELVLFLGAGFSLGATARSGNGVPSVEQLKWDLWNLSYPNEEFDDSTTLGEIFELLQRRNPQGLRDYLEVHLSAEADSLPEFYRLYFGFPWLRIFTLNIDDLELAAARRWDFSRKIIPISAAAPDLESIPRSRQEHSALEVVHLNGMLGDPIDKLTFSEVQYAQRIANKEPWYARCVADITARPTVFIGTELREPPLWEHLELRKRRITSKEDRRPTSILVTPSLSPARRELVRDLRIDWIEGTAQTFADDVLKTLEPEADKGRESAGVGHGVPAPGLRRGAHRPRRSSRRSRCQE